MATQSKLTIKLGKTSKDIVNAAGSTISGGDAIEINIDATKMTKGDALAALEHVRRRIIESKWPLPTS